MKCDIFFGVSDIRKQFFVRSKAAFSQPPHSGLPDFITDEVSVPSDRSQNVPRKTAAPEFGENKDGFHPMFINYIVRPDEFTYRILSNR